MFRFFAAAYAVCADKFNGAIVMARKVVVPESEGGKPIKKKKGLNKCCSCLLVFGIVVLVILGIAFGIGWYFGDKYCKEYLDMSLGDAFGVVNKLYWANDEKVVKNPYSDEDLGKFYNEIKENILLKSDAEVDFDSALNSAIEGFVKKDSAAKSALNSAADGDSESSDGNVLDIFVDMVADVFVRENIDTERLMKWSPEEDNYIFHLNDKQLAAFINSVLNVILSSADSMDEFKQFSGMIDIKNIIALKQIKFTAISTPDEQNVDRITATAADITVWIGLQDAVGQALSKLVTDAGAGWTSGLVTFVGNVLLPKNLYANISLPLQGDGQAMISLNDMNSGERANMYKLVDGIMSLVGGDMSIDGLLGDITEQIKPFIEKMSGKMDFSSATGGTITMDLLGSMAEIAASSAGEGEALSKADFMYMLQAVIGSSPEKALAELEPHLYDGWYVTADGELTRTATDTAVNYESEFVSEIEYKYALNVPTSDGNKDIDSVLKMLNISIGDSGSGGGLDVMNSLQTSRLRALALSDDDVAMHITDRMLGAVLEGQMDKLSDTGSFDKVSFDLEAISIIGNADRAEHTYMLLAVRIGLFDMFDALGSENMLGKLVKNVVSDHLLIQMTIDISDIVSGMPSEQLDDNKYRINDCDNTDSVLNSLRKLVPGLDLDQVGGEVANNVTKMLETLSDKFDIRFVTYDAAAKTQGAIVLPDVFTVISKLALTENGQAVLTGPELKSTLRVLYDDDVASVGVAPGADYNGFTEQIKDKYYLNPGASDDISTFDGLAAFLASGSDDSFDGTKFLVKAELNDDKELLPLDPNRKYMAYDTRDINELKPTMSKADLGALIKSETGDNASLKSFTITEVGSAADTLYIMLRAELSSLLSGNDVADILDIDSLYVTATVNTGKIKETGGKLGYEVSLKINNADSADPDENSDYHLILRLIKHFDDGNSFDIESQVAEVGITLYEQISNMQSSLGGGDGFMKFTADGLQIGGFYEFLTNKLWGDKDDPPSPEDVKSVIQSMYARHADYSANTDNYVKTDFIKNESAAQDMNYNEFISSSESDVTDYELNGLLYKRVQDMSGDVPNGVYARQTIILSAINGEMTAQPNAQYIRTWIGEHIASVKTNEGGHFTAATEYLLVTFEMNMKEFMNNSDMAKGFMPDVIYATIVFEKTKEWKDLPLFGNTYADTFTNIGTVFNNMTPEQYDIMVDLMGLNTPELSDEDKKNTVNIETVTEESEKVLNGISALGSVTFGISDPTEQGIGKLTYRKRISIPTMP